MDLKSCAMESSNVTSDMIYDNHSAPLNLLEPNDTDVLCYYLKNATDLPSYVFFVTLALKFLSISLFGYFILLCCNYIRIDHPVYATVFQNLLVSFFFSLASFVVTTIVTITEQNLSLGILIFEMCINTFMMSITNVSWTVITYLRAYILVIKSDTPDLNMKPLMYKSLPVPWCAAIFVAGFRMFLAFGLQLSDVTRTIIVGGLLFLPIAISIGIHLWTEHELRTSVRPILHAQNGSEPRGNSNRMNSHHPTMLENHERRQCWQHQLQYSHQRGEVALNVSDLRASQEASNLHQHQLQVRKSQPGIYTLAY